MATAFAINGACAAAARSRKCEIGQIAGSLRTLCHCFDHALLFAIVLRAEPLCIARWSVVSLFIKYRGSSFEAWTVYPLKMISEVCFFLMVPRTRPASEFHSTWSPILRLCTIGCSPGKDCSKIDHFHCEVKPRQNSVKNALNRIRYESFLDYAADRSSNRNEQRRRIDSQPDKDDCERSQHEDCRGRPVWNRFVGPVAGSRLREQRDNNSQVVEQPDGARNHENQNQRPGSHGGARCNDIELAKETRRERNPREG